MIIVSKGFFIRFNCLCTFQTANVQNIQSNKKKTLLIRLRLTFYFRFTRTSIILSSMIVMIVFLLNRRYNSKHI
jgi:apolipoprotein N-acyltransferase